MRSFFCLMLLSFLVTTTSNAAMKNGIPEIVDKAFKKQFPEVQDVSWIQTESIEFFSVSFFDDTDANYKTAKFNAQGKWMSTATSLSFDLLMSSITDYIEETYDELEYVSIEFIESLDEASHYKVSIEVEEDEEEFTSYDLIFDEKGKLVKD